MNVNNLTILGLTQYGVPSGNYDGSSMDFDSDGTKGVAYYRGQGSIQTVYQHITGFQGIIVIQATLDQNWETARWVDVNTFDCSSGPVTTYQPVSLVGNYTWLRANIKEFSAGQIDSITVVY
jgi:hypothetical protein